MNYHNLSIWHKFTSFFRFSNFIMIDWCNTFANCLLSKATSHLILVPLYVLQYFLITETSPRSCSCRDFSLMSKSHIFKNLNLRKKADYNFRGTFLRNRFSHQKLYSNLTSWLARCRCHMGTFWKTKDWSFERAIFERARPSCFGTWKFTTREDLNQPKQVFILKFIPWTTQKPKIWSIFYGKNVI